MKPVIAKLLSWELSFRRYFCWQQKLPTYYSHQKNQIYCPFFIENYFLTEFSIADSVENTQTLCDFLMKWM